jgi:hypothetical protein
MKKHEIIQLTLKQMQHEHKLSPEELADCQGIACDDDMVIAELNELLPSGDIKTCLNFSDLGVACCPICHSVSPDVDMRVETLPDGSKAWICCKVRSALLEPEAKVDELPDFVDMEGVFAVLLPKVGIVFVHAGCLWVDSTPIDDAIRYGEVLTHEKGHADFWHELQACGAVSKDETYDEVPRGRVCYDTRERVYHLYLDRCILRDQEMVKKIIGAMTLPSAPRTEITTDSHYRCPECMFRPGE